MKINQSLIKRLDKEYCPKKVKAEMDGTWKRTASEAMIKGQYFEWLLFKTKNREGQVPVMPLLKNGKKSTDQIRIEAQAKKFFEVCEKYDIKFFGTDRTFHTKLFGHETFGTWDGYGLIKGKKPLIIDIKLPGNINNDFGDFCWGDISSMDMIQPEMYMTAGRKIDQINYDFLFMIFDYKSKPDFKLEFINFQEDTAFRVQARLEDTKTKIAFHNTHGWKPVGNPKECKDCPFSDSCSEFTSKAIRKENWKKKQIAKVVSEQEKQKAQKELDDLLEGVFEEEFTL